MAYIIAIANQKGGVGKTTTAVSLSMALSEMGKKVLLIDSDPQANAGNGLNLKPKLTFYDFLWNENKDPKIFIQKTLWPDFHLICADSRLSGVDLEWVNLDQNTFILEKKIKPFFNDYDYIFIDCPPSLGLLTVNALTASRHFIVPLQCEYYALEGLSLLLETAKAIKDNLNSRLSLLGILLTMFDLRNTLSHKVAEQVKGYFKTQVFETLIPRNVRLSEAPSHGLPISKYAKNSAGATAYEKFALELNQKISFQKEQEIQL